MKVKIKLEEGGKCPTKAHPSDACFDVYCREIEEVAPGKVICYLGFSSEIPEGYKAVIQPRSSFTHKDWVMQNSPGQVDSGYRNEWQMKFQAIPVWVPERESLFGSTLPGYWGYPDFIYKVGDRCGQFSIEKIVDTTLEVVEEELLESERKGGFGHTGN